MAGTTDGGRAAAATNKTKYGSDFYTKIGSMGGKKGKTGGWWANIACKDSNCAYHAAESPHWIRQCAGSRGGTKSRRKKKT